MTTKSTHNFQVNLKGMIELLSNHLYSHPKVFIRELLQNCIDAITAKQRNQFFDPQITFELIGNEVGSRTLCISDNGIGLTEDEVHRFLATIGHSSKRESLDALGNDFIGRFGIGLLSCFMVSEEITLLTRSIHEESGKTIQWIGKADGSYEVSHVKECDSVGTKVYLHEKNDSDEYFTFDFIKEALENYGAYLPHRIILKDGANEVTVGNRAFPWCSKEESDEMYLQFGKEHFDLHFLSYIPIKGHEGEIIGTAFILPHSTSISTKNSHSIYVKGMLVTEKPRNLLPEWASFAKVILNCSNLTVTASREEFFDDNETTRIRNYIDQSLREYLVDLGHTYPRKMEEFVQVHYHSIKALVAEDPSCFNLFIDWLPFETSVGRLTFKEIKSHFSVASIIEDNDQFRKVSVIAAAEGLCIINCSYMYDYQILSNVARYSSEIIIEEIESTDIVNQFSSLTDDEFNRSQILVTLSNKTLSSFKCTCSIGKFAPDTLPVIFLENESARFTRELDETREQSDDLFSSILDDISSESVFQEASSEICFNYNNSLIQKLLTLKNERLLSSLISMLYVQSLLLGHQKTGPNEMNHLNKSIEEIISLGLQGEIE